MLFLFWLSSYFKFMSKNGKVLLVQFSVDCKVFQNKSSQIKYASISNLNMYLNISDSFLKNLPFLKNLINI